MENEQNGGRRKSITESYGLLMEAITVATEPNSEARRQLVPLADSLSGKARDADTDARRAEADTALLRDALQKVKEVSEELEPFRVADEALKATNAGQSLLDRLKSAEEQVEQLTKERDVLYNFVRTSAECPLCAGVSECGDDCPYSEANPDAADAINHARNTLAALDKLKEGK